MSDGTIYRVAARIGTAVQAAMAMLVPGELGWDEDTKTLRVGDDTNNPPKVPTSKSVGTVEFHDNFKPLFAEILIKDGGLVDGADLSQLTADSGLIVRVPAVDETPGFFKHISLEADEQYFLIENPDGKDGNPRITLNEEFAGGFGGGRVAYYKGTEPPESAPPGSMFYHVDLHILHIQIAYDDDPNHMIWVDMQTIGSKHRNGGVAFFVGINPPATAAIGDEFQHFNTGKLYKYFADSNGFHWRQLRV